MIPSFRAWDIHKKKMFTNDQIIIWNNNIYANDERKLNPDRLTGWSVDDKYLMQSTGLVDKNGVEIYEGDIVSLHHFTVNHFAGGGVYEGENVLKGVVELTRIFENIYGKSYPAEWVLSVKDDYYLINLIEGIHEESFEVLGNQWENPELLEDTK